MILVCVGLKSRLACLSPLAHGLSQGCNQMLADATVISGLVWRGSASQITFVIIGWILFLPDHWAEGLSSSLVRHWLEATLSSLPHKTPYRASHNMVVDFHLRSKRVKDQRRTIKTEATGFLYLILEVASNHICCILRIGNESLGLIQSQERGLHKDNK